MTGTPSSLISTPPRNANGLQHRHLLRSLFIVISIAIHTLTVAVGDEPTTRWHDSGGQPLAAVALAFANASANTQLPDISALERPDSEPSGLSEELHLGPETNEPLRHVDRQPAIAETKQAGTQKQEEPQLGMASKANLSKSKEASPGAHSEPAISEPVFASAPTPPRYPTVARKRGQEGVAWIDIWLDEQGGQTRLAVLKSSGQEVLDEAAIEAVRTWEFKPRIVDGIAMASRIHIPIEFSLK